jgi:hypothetical protein
MPKEIITQHLDHTVRSLCTIGTDFDLHKRVTPPRFPSAAAATGAQNGTPELLKRVLLNQMRSKSSNSREAI